MNIKLATIAISAMVFVAGISPATLSAKTWVVPGDFPTIQRAIDSPEVLAGDTVYVRRGSHRGAFVKKDVTIRGQNGTIIDSGPTMPNLPGKRSGFYFSSLQNGSGATIDNFKFESVDFPVYNNSANIDDITIQDCSMTNPLQGITNWGGAGWTVRDNTITHLRTYCGGGIGVLLGGRYLDHKTIDSSKVTSNVISGTLNVPSNDCGGYIAAGVALLGDTRLGLDPLQSTLTTNEIGSLADGSLGNSLSLTSSRPGSVEVYGIMLNEIANATGTYVIHANTIENNLLTMENQVAVRPPGLCEQNARNVGGTLYINGKSCPAQDEATVPEKSRKLSKQAEVQLRAY